MSIRGRLTTVLLIVLIPLFLFSACDLLTGEVTPLVIKKKEKEWVSLANYLDKSLLRTEFACSLISQIFSNLEQTPRWS